MNDDTTRWYGKYAGRVTAVDDPLKLGRVRAVVPAVLGDQPTGWAWPCVPFAGRNDKGRGLFLVPEEGDLVWIEFAGGDLRQPIWAGCFWPLPESLVDQADGLEKVSDPKDTVLPTVDDEPAAAGRQVLRTKAGHTVAFDDEGGVLVVAAGAEGKAEIRMDATGKVVVTAEEIHLGSESSKEKLVLGDAFMKFFNTHTHPTGVGPSGAPTQGMSTSHLSKKVTTE